MVLVLSHLGTWEVFAQLMPKFVGFVRGASVYQGLGNRFIDKHVRRTRSQTGLELFDRHDGFEPVIDLLRSGGGVGVLSDQHAGDHGVWTPFFGRLASTSPLPALLAKRTRAALIAAGVYTTGPARWRMVFTERFDETGASVAVLTSKINQVIEEQIRRAPEDWFWVHNRWKTPEPNFLLAHYKRGIYLPPGISASDLKPFRILIRSSNWLGDAVMSVPAVRAIKNGRPDVHVTIAAPDKIAPMWKLIPEVDAIIPLPEGSLLSVVRLLRQQMPFDVAILFPNSLRVALESWLSGIPRRVGYRGHWRSWLVNQIVREPRKPGPPEHHSLRFLRIARECGAETSNIEVPNPNQTSNIKHQTLIGLCPGAEYGPAKRWLPERFAEAAAKITAQSSAQWILLRDEERRRNRRTDRRCDRRSLREPDRADNARSTYRRIAAVQFATHQRHGHDASCRVTRRACGRRFRLDRTAPDRTTRQRAYYFATPCRMQPLFSPRMSNRFPLHESRQRRRSRGCCAVDARQVNFTFEIERRDL